MSRICDFCQKKEPPYMCESLSEEKNRHGIAINSVHICLDCAEIALTGMVAERRLSQSTKGSEG